jgi:hypothetical protein
LAILGASGKFINKNNFILLLRCWKDHIAKLFIWS